MKKIPEWLYQSSIRTCRARLLCSWRKGRVVRHNPVLQSRFRPPLLHRKSIHKEYRICNISFSISIKKKDLRHTIHPDSSGDSVWHIFYPSCALPLQILLDQVCDLAPDMLTPVLIHPVQWVLVDQTEPGKFRGYSSHRAKQDTENPHFTSLLGL